MAIYFRLLKTLPGFRVHGKLYPPANESKEELLGLTTEVVSIYPC